MSQSNTSFNTPNYEINIETQNNSIQFTEDILKRLNELTNSINKINQEELHSYLINELEKQNSDEDKNKFFDNVKEICETNILNNYYNIYNKGITQDAKLTALKIILDNNINYQEFLSRIHKSSILILSADRTLSIDTLKYLLENQYADLIPLKIFFVFQFI